MFTYEVFRIATGVLIAATSTIANAQDVTVTTTDDVVDFGGLQQIGNLPGPDGLVSFREACTAVNNTLGPQTIAFAIPNSASNEWTGGVAILFMNYSPFVLSDDGTTVDFTTQTAFTGDTNPNGNEIGVRCAPISGAPAVYVSGNSCTVKGLDRVSYCGYGVQLAGDDNRVIGCTISGPLYAGVYVSAGFSSPPARNNVVGGLLPGEGNYLSSGNDGVRIDAPADDNVVIGNVLTGTFHGAAVRGSIYTTFPNGNRIGGPTPAERNLIAGAGKYGEEGFPDGAQVSVEHANGTIVEGNYIGTTPDGSAPAPGQIGPEGVSVVDSTGTVVRGNVISGIRVAGTFHYAGQVFGDGVHVTTVNGPTANTTIADNLIGTDASGMSAVPNHYGIRVAPFIASYGTTNTQVSSNTIAFNDLTGLVVAYSVSGVRVSGNSFASNGQLGIDLLGPGGVSGVTANDPLDADLGGNGLQNFPVIASATIEGASIHVSGSLDTSPLGDFTVEFHASPVPDPSGFGEGRTPLGTTTVSTDAGGHADFDLSLGTLVPAGWFVSATATAEPSGSTSEFAASVALSGTAFASYCTAGTSANGCQATISASGVPSATAASGFSLDAADVEAGKDGLFFFGTNGRQTMPWGNGTSYQCVAPPVGRSALMVGANHRDACGGSFSQDLNALWCPTCPKPQKNPGAGNLVQAQLWYRDPFNTSNQTTSLSDAVEFLVGP